MNNRGLNILVDIDKVDIKDCRFFVQIHTSEDWSECGVELLN